MSVSVHLNKLQNLFSRGKLAKGCELLREINYELGHNQILIMALKFKDLIMSETIKKLEFALNFKRDDNFTMKLEECLGFLVDNACLEIKNNSQEIFLLSKPSKQLK